ncbi:MAG: polyphosphate kinase 2 family protein, partial [Phycisphaeraceae bacterium]|nr:polyphosphate kinase 2 family protein [Phycisphaeraceae bacterium]
MIDLDQYRVKPGDRPDLSKIPTRADAGLDAKSDGETLLAANVERIDELQGRLWAESRRSVLLVLQGMDTSGKDGTIRKVFTGVNPAAFEIHQFGVPGPHEIAQD